MTTLAQLQDLCVPSAAHPWISSPVLRSRNGQVWTCAITAGHTILAVRGALTENAAGPALVAVTRERKSRPISARFADLKEFVARDRKPLPDGAQCVRIAGVPVDTRKLRPLLDLVSAAAVRLAASAEAKPHGPSCYVCPRHLHIEARGWLIVVAGYAHRPSAEFPTPKVKP